MEMEAVEAAEADRREAVEAVEAVEAAQAADEANEAHALYARLGLIIVSGRMSAERDKNGEWKKKFGFAKGWQTTTSRDYNKRATGFALVCSRESGCTAIDIDDPETESNRLLMRLMDGCNLAAKTKKGLHYVLR